MNKKAVRMEWRLSDATLSTGYLRVLNLSTLCAPEKHNEVQQYHTKLAKNNFEKNGRSHSCYFEASHAKAHTHTPTAVKITFPLKTGCVHLS